MAQLILLVTTTLRATLLLCGLIVACSDDQGPAVPFKLGEPDHNTPAQAIDQQPAQAETPTLPTAQVSQSYAPNTASITINNTAVRATDASFVAALALDLGADQTQDVLAITESTQGVITLQRALHGEPLLSPVAPLYTRDKGCQVKDASARLSSIAQGYVWATLDVACETDTSAHTTGTRPEAITSLHWLLSTDATPRVMERIALLPEPHTTLATALSLNVQATDVDGDQNNDVVATLKITTLDGTQSEVPLRWLNRVAGLDRDRTEPEATLNQKLLATKPSRVSHETRARVLNEIVMIHALLCSESGRARIAIGGRTGLTCGRSKAAGNAWAALTKIYAEHPTDEHPTNGQAGLLHALDAFEKLNDPAFTVDATERTSAEAALKSIGAAAHWQWRPGPNIVEAHAPNTRMSMIGFVDDHTLLLRGATQQNYDVLTDTLTTASETPSDLLVRNPAGDLAVVGIERRCDGYRLKIVRADQVTGGMVLGASVSEPLIDPRTAPSDARCGANASYRGKNDSGWNVLGWSSGAILLANGRELHQLPLDAMTHAIGAATPATIRLPVPNAPGVVASDGSAAVMPTPVGLLVLSAAGSTLIEPLGPVSPLDLAVAPNGARVAYVFGGRVFIGNPVPATP